MKTKITSIVITVLFALAFVNCTNSAKSDDNQTQSNIESNMGLENVKVYYFHGTRRCATCNAVEKVTREALNEYYQDKIEFQSINRELDKNMKMVRKYKISSSTLIIVNGDKVENITNEAFMNARSNPEKLKAKVKETIESITKA